MVKKIARECRGYRIAIALQNNLESMRAWAGEGQVLFHPILLESENFAS